MRLYIIRHADPDYPNNALSPAGHLEAAALARRLAAHGLDHIYTSPLPRAYLTAQYTADLLKLPVQTEAWLIEVAGMGWIPEPDDPDDSIPAWDIPGVMLRREPGFHAWDTWHTLPPLDSPHMRDIFEHYAASADAFLARHGCVRDGVRYRIAADNTLRIAAFCHNGTALLWLAHLLHIPPPLVWAGFWHPPSGVTTVLFERRSEGGSEPAYAAPRCLSVADTSHLYEARLPIQPRGIRGNYG